MRIIDFPSAPAFQFLFLNAGRGPGQYYQDTLPIHVAKVDQLPDDLSAIVLTADLQGRERFEDGNGGPLRLLGEVLPRRLIDEIFPRLSLHDPSRVAAWLAGDFYTLPLLDRRGGSGDVTAVWQAFADAFRWVAGVAGNHDTFGEPPSKRPRLPVNAHFLEGDLQTVAGLKIAGLGGIIGNIKRPQRRSELDYFDTLQRLADHQPDVLLMHDGPDGTERGQPGLSRAREILQAWDIPLVVRGHSHWEPPFAEFPNGLQIINVDARVVILTE